MMLAQSLSKMDALEVEEWRPVAGYEGHYEVSDTGHVRSVKRGFPVLMFPWLTDHGYLRLKLSLDGRARIHFVHVLVAHAFFGPKPKGEEVRHRNGKGIENHVGNLHYGTHSLNTLDSVRHGTHAMARKTHCKRGHEFTPENTAASYTGRGTPCRRCRKCDAYRASIRRAGLT